jgi:ABC-type sugar transport system ATPase subunit
MTSVPPGPAHTDDRSLAEVVLGVRGVTKRFGGTTALRGVTMDVAHGESMALLGANGAGKSTLVKIISGASRPDEGHLVIDGQIGSLSGVHEARSRGICFVPQELTVAAELTVAENVLAGGWPATSGFARHRAGLQQVEGVCARIGLRVSPNALCGSLSPAERRLLMIARGLVVEPRILILDEPTAALGEREADRLVEVLGLLRAERLSMIYISHRMNEISRLCDSVTVLRNGEVVMRDSATDENVHRAVQVGMASTAVLEDDSPAHAGHELPVSARHGSALRARGLSNSVLHDVSVEVGIGEIVGIAGLLGSGRSELLRALAGADRLDSGEVEVFGEAVALRSSRDGIRAGVALIPEDRRNQGALLTLPISDNLVLPSIPARGPWLRRRAEARLAAEAVDRYGIKCSSPDALLGTLSGGNQQKVILARWLMTGARVLLLDEPTAGIDVVAKAELMALVRQAVDEGRAAIVVSSELDELSGFCDRIYVLGEGRVRHEVAGDTTVVALTHLCAASAAVAGL